jgi:hypothetical protein
MLSFGLLFERIFSPKHATSKYNFRKLQNLYSKTEYLISAKMSPLTLEIPLATQHSEGFIPVHSLMGVS